MTPQKPGLIQLTERQQKIGAYLVAMAVVIALVVLAVVVSPKASAHGVPTSPHSKGSTWNPQHSPSSGDSYTRSPRPSSDAPSTPCATTSSPGTSTSPGTPTSSPSTPTSSSSSSSPSPSVTPPATSPSTSPSGPSSSAPSTPASTPPGSTPATSPISKPLLPQSAPPRSSWITSISSACNQATIRFNLPSAQSFQLVDANGTVPFDPVAITRPAGRSTYVFNLPSAIREGTSDTVEIWSGVPTATLAVVTVPVNCPKLVAASPLATGGATPSSQAAAPPAGLASTGVPEWLVYLSVLGVLGLLIGTGLVFGTHRGRHEVEPVVESVDFEQFRIDPDAHQ